MLFVEEIRGNHHLIMENGKKLTLSGVKDVLAFDEETIQMETALGRMTVKGTAMRIIGFDHETGDLTAEGRFYAVAYSAQESGGFFSRLFR